MQYLSGQAIRTPTFRRFAQINSQKTEPIFEAIGQIRANRVFSPIRIEIRVIRVQSSLLSIFWKVDSQKNRFFFFFSKRESIHREYSGFESRIDSRESAH